MNVAATQPQPHTTHVYPQQQQYGYAPTGATPPVMAYGGGAAEPRGADYVTKPSSTSYGLPADSVAPQPQYVYPPQQQQFQYGHHPQQHPPPPNATAPVVAYGGQFPATYIPAGVPGTTLVQPPSSGTYPARYRPSGQIFHPPDAEGVCPTDPLRGGMFTTYDREAVPTYEAPLTFAGTQDVTLKHVSPLKTATESLREIDQHQQRSRHHSATAKPDGRRAPRQRALPEGAFPQPKRSPRLFKETTSGKPRTGCCGC